jgi:TRAP-type uncharacterized transport system substrate-binding protein
MSLSRARRWRAQVVDSRGKRRRSAPRALALAVTLAVALLAGAAARAEPVVTLLRGAAADGSARFVEDLAQLWRMSNGGEPSVLAQAAVAGPPEARLKALRRMRGDFAIVDAPTLIARREAYPDLVAVAVLWPLALQVLTRRPEAVPLGELPADAWVVAENRPYALAMLAALFPPAEGAAPAGQPGAGPSARALAATLEQQPAAVALVAGPVPVAEVEQALAQVARLRLAPLARPLLERVRQLGPGFVPLTIPKTAYPNLPGAVETVGLNLVLVARLDLPPHLARRAVDALYHLPAAAAYDPLFAALNPRANAALAAVFPFHEAAAKALGLPTQAVEP